MTVHTRWTKGLRLALVVFGFLGVTSWWAEARSEEQLRLTWRRDAVSGREFLTVRGPRLPEEGLVIWHLEAFCRPGSTNRAWEETVIPHHTELIDQAPDGSQILLRSQLEDGVTVDQRIEVDPHEPDVVRFALTCRNPTDRVSLAHWGQSCVRVANFTGHPERPGAEDYLPQVFVGIEGELTFLPCQPWSRTARYTPGQVFRPAHVDPQDLNPRPVNRRLADPGLIGCVSADRQSLVAVAWQPYQELFQGVIVCIHADFRIGGLEPGGEKLVRGALYVMENDRERLLRRYRRDFPQTNQGDLLKGSPKVSSSMKGVPR
ncbi:hypothetical protein Isop_1263 [Isosphaera pallida ATCC 43644]|uniref:Uncharacterized protein n=1 Tax=Isosphaera pallida (strain ATCC 43644 / DSM 9630 / IS1B) TaxID=575540 RepID=E8R6E8_ISOPI|nr:hypothetical protein [Isosphaera pallida]ADV61849.1 hypothetical protein Isop_1263 [Isosphaera pallida ATCC 43644]